MIENNKFFIDKFNKIVIFGQPHPKIIEINKKLKIDSLVITSSDQAKLMDKKLIDFKIFNSVDKKCVNEIENFCDIKKTLFIGIGPRYIFTKKTINLFKNNFINMHNSRVPLDAGGGAFSWRILREDRIDNRCFHLMTQDIDGGPIIYNSLSLYPKSCITPLDMKEYSTNLTIKFYGEFINKLFNKKKFDLQSQPKYLSRYNPRLNTNINGYIDWSLNSYELINFINAFDNFYKGASTYLNNGNFGKLYIRKAQLHGGDTPTHSFMSGIVSRHDKNWIVVCTSGKHMLLIEEVVDKKGKNILEKIKPGDRFFTPSNKLDISKSKRVYYNALGLK